MILSMWNPIMSNTKQTIGHTIPSKYGFLFSKAKKMRGTERKIYLIVSAATEHGTNVFHRFVHIQLQRKMWRISAIAIFTRKDRISHPPM